MDLQCFFAELLSIADDWGGLAMQCAHTLATGFFVVTQARVEKAGGQVLYWNGHRVMGVLAMSRAIGDHGLRPYVIPEPEVRAAASRRCLLV